MEFDVKKQKISNVEKYPKDDLTIAYKFAKKAYDEFGNFIKAIVLFGSSVREEKTKGDIDVLILVDDITIQMTAEIVETYRIIIEKSVADISPRLHVTSLKLTTFWEYVRMGDPIGLNILRDGVALLDTGFFDPLQGLLARGRIRPSPEAIYSYFYRAPRTLSNSRWHLLQATLDLYWAVIDSAHAALMKLGESPATPEHVADLMDTAMVKKGKVERRYAETMRLFYSLSRQILHRELKEITGPAYEKYFQQAADFVERMQKIVTEK